MSSNETRRPSLKELEAEQARTKRKTSDVAKGKNAPLSDFDIQVLGSSGSERDKGPKRPKNLTPAQLASQQASAKAKATPQAPTTPPAPTIPPPVNAPSKTVAVEDDDMEWFGALMEQAVQQPMVTSALNMAEMRILSATFWFIFLTTGSIDQNFLLQQLAVNVGPIDGREWNEKTMTLKVVFNVAMMETGAFETFKYTSATDFGLTVEEGRKTTFPTLSKYTMRKDDRDGFVTCADFLMANFNIEVRPATGMVEAQALFQINVVNLPPQADGDMLFAGLEAVGIPKKDVCQLMFKIGAKGTPTMAYFKVRQEALKDRIIQVALGCTLPDGNTTRFCPFQESMVNTPPTTAIMLTNLAKSSLVGNSTLSNYVFSILTKGQLAAMEAISMCSPEQKTKLTELTRKGKFGYWSCPSVISIKKVIPRLNYKGEWLGESVMAFSTEAEANWAVATLNKYAAPFTPNQLPQVRDKAYGKLKAVLFSKYWEELNKTKNN